MTGKTLRKQMHEALDAVEKATKEFGDNPAKVQQLRAHLATCHMVVDDLFDTRPLPSTTE